MKAAKEMTSRDQVFALWIQGKTSKQITRSLRFIPKGTIYAYVSKFKQEAAIKKTPTQQVKISEGLPTPFKNEKKISRVDLICKIWESRLDKHNKRTLTAFAESL